MLTGYGPHQISATKALLAPACERERSPSASG